MSKISICPHCGENVNYLNHKYHLYMYCQKQIIMKTQEQCRMTKGVVKTTCTPDKQTELGVDILIPKKSNVEINHTGAKKEFMCDSVEILIGIGKDYTAYLTMDIEALEALKNGEPITILHFTEE